MKEIKDPEDEEMTQKCQFGDIVGHAARFVGDRLMGQLKESKSFRDILSKKLPKTGMKKFRTGRKRGYHVPMSLIDADGSHNGQRKRRRTSK